MTDYVVNCELPSGHSLSITNLGRDDATALAKIIHDAGWLVWMTEKTEKTIEL